MKINKDSLSMRAKNIANNKDVTFDNGLYRYSKFDNDSKHDFYVIKEELMGYLKETIFYVSIVFKSAIDIDDSKIINLNNSTTI